MQYKNLISIEGIEGAGKSTQIKLICDYLKEKSYQVSVFREPGGTEFGEKLREAILSSDTKISPVAEAHLFAASRAQLLSQKVLPLLCDPKHIVILDRFIDSSIAYQGFARELGAEFIESLHNKAPLDTRPVLSLYLSISVEVSMQRQQKRGHEKDYFEKEKELFYQKLIDGFEYQVKNDPQRFIKIDAKGSIEQNFNEIKNYLEKYYG